MILKIFSNSRAQVVVQYLAAKQWRLVGSQVAVGDPSRRRATAIDLLCRDADGGYVVVEVKTRSVSIAYHEETYKKLQPDNPNSALGVPNSLYWRHQCQLIQTVQMFKLSKKAQGKKVRGVVLVSIQGSCLCYPMEVKKKSS